MHPPPILSRCALMALAALAACPVTAAEVAPPLRLHGFLESLEIAPVLLAVERHYPDRGSAPVLKRGGIANLVGGVTTNYGEAGVADVATNAETQLLRNSVANPGLRLIMTVTEGRYRIVARRSSGIGRLADLKGKRVGTMPNTSAAYFLERMLGSAGLKPADVVTVGDIDLPQLSAALVDGRIDALAMWSPEPEEAELALGSNAISFSGDGVYREIFNLNTNVETLSDPRKRAAIKQLMKAVMAASADITRDPRAAQQLVIGRMSDYPPSAVTNSWTHHRYLAGKVPDLLDVMVEEEQWLARVDKRQPRDHVALARLIDYSLLDEITSEGAR